jgi:hypothetical protein
MFQARGSAASTLAPMSEVSFRTSLYGRFSHVVLALLALIIGVIGAVPLLLRGTSQSEFLMLLGSGLFSGGALAVSLYSVWFAIAPGERIRFSNDALFYRGFFGSLNLPWSEIESAQLNYAGRSPFVFLLLRRRGSHSAKKVNVSGLTPSYEVLFELLSKRAPHAVGSSNGYGLAEALAGKGTDEL